MTKPIISFRIDPQNQQLLDLLKKIGRNKAEFINEAIKMHGPTLIRKMEEDWKHVHDYMSSLEPTFEVPEEPEEKK